MQLRPSVCLAICLSIFGQLITARNFKIPRFALSRTTLLTPPASTKPCEKMTEDNGLLMIAADARATAYPIRSGVYLDMQGNLLRTVSIAYCTQNKRLMIVCCPVGDRERLLLYPLKAFIDYTINAQGKRVFQLELMEQSFLDELAALFPASLETVPLATNYEAAK